MLIFYLLGCIVSLYIVLKYSPTIEIFKKLTNDEYYKNNRGSQIVGLTWSIIVALAYVSLSWIGALVTYIIFKFG